MRGRSRAWSGLRQRWRVVILTAAVLAVSGVLLWGWAVARAAHSARRALAAARYADAQERARSWLHLRPGAAEANYVIARAALALGQPERFQESSRRALAAGLAPPRRALLRALVDVGRGHPAGTEPALLAAIAAGDGPDPQIDEALARVYLETFRLRQAEAVLDRWATEAPEDPRPYLWRAEVDRRVQRGPDALEADYRRALARAPRMPAARLGLADALSGLRRFTEASLEYTAYLDLRPDDPAGHLGAAQAAHALGNDAERKQHLERVLVLDPGNVAALKLKAEVAARRGDISSALVDLDRAVNVAPFEVDIRYTRSLLYARVGRRDDMAHEQAIVQRLRAEHGRLNELRESLLRAPGDDDLKAELGRWMLDHGHDEEGRRWAAEVLRRRPGHPLANQLLVTYHTRRGEAGLANFYRSQAEPSGK
ncbi:MAG: tetratricopeptide repeat protein [Isosphaeraceae bacterium]|nr:tetratricopeptide repeat protein [Isosphaeraceae bacterium]